jgi:hypothetical protein
MAVLVIASVPGQTRELYDGMLSALGGPLQAANGFIAHFAIPSDDSWQVMELWETERDANQFFATFVHPNLPDGIKPRRTFKQLHSLVRS